MHNETISVNALKKKWLTNATPAYAEELLIKLRAAGKQVEISKPYSLSIVCNYQEHLVGIYETIEDATIKEF